MRITPRRHHRHDKLAVRCENTIHLAASNEWLHPVLFKQALTVAV
jgi:hypothetical protein